MNQYLTGNTIKLLREKKKLTQAELAEQLHITDKTVSKWETGKGYPDITLLEPLARIFGVSVLELLNGNPVENANISANLLRSEFFICPVCGNVITALGNAVISCHGITLLPAEAEEADECHTVSVENIEDEWFVTVNHDMTKQHHISFLAAVGCDRVQFVKLYPEGEAQARFKRSLVKYIYLYCNRDGLFRYKIK